MHRFVIALVVCGSALAHADNIEEKRQKDAAEKLVAIEIKSMNTACKTSVPETGVIDWGSWKTIADEKNNSAGSRCKYVAYGIENLCRGDKIAQETVAKDLKKISCMGDATDDIKFELKGDTLVVHSHLLVKDVDKKTKTWLTKNLQ
jgi:hypothetical protein